jgi:hypothetical protein
MPLRVTNCSVSTNSISITFSEPVLSDATAASGTNAANYTIFDPGSVDFSQPQTVQAALTTAQTVGSSPFNATLSPVPNGLLVAISFVSSVGTSEFQAGDWVHITVNNVKAQNGETLEGGQASFARQVPGAPLDARRATRDVEDSISYPILTEEVAYRPSSPVGMSTTGAGGIGGPGAFSLGQTAQQAVTDVLGWKINPADPKGFIGALTQSFDLTEVEGHVESKWVPRTYAVQTDLGGGITGAQASLYMRAKDALDQALTLLDGLYPLDPDADPEYVRALREMARSQMTEIVKEFGVVGLPSILRINTYFQILLGQDIAHEPAAVVQLDPDEIAGTLGQIRDTYGIYFEGNPWNNTIADEQDITNFRVISDYMTSLMQSWIANRRFFVISPRTPAFFGTQLVLISRQFNVIAEAVNEVRFSLDSVFIGPNERQMLLLKFAGHTYPSMYLEDVLEEVDSFVSDEGPRLLRDGGKISVTNNILPVVKELRDMIRQTRDQRDRDVPRGFKTARVRRSMDDLHGQLDALIKLTEQVEQRLPVPEYGLTISGVVVTSESDDANPDGSTDWYLSIYGSAFDPAIDVFVHSSVAEGIECDMVNFWSAERIDISFPLPSSGFAVSSHDIVVTNPDGETITLVGALIWDGTNLTAAALNGGNDGGNGNGGGFGNGNGGGGGGSYASTATPALRRAPRSYAVVKTVGGDSVDTSPAAAVAQTPSPGVATSPTTQTEYTAVTKNAAKVVIPASGQKLTPVTGNVEGFKGTESSPAGSSGTGTSAAPTKEEMAEMLKKNHPTFWEKFKDEF